MALPAMSFNHEGQPASRRAGSGDEAEKVPWSKAFAAPDSAEQGKLSGNCSHRSRDFESSDQAIWSSDQGARRLGLMLEHTLVGGESARRPNKVKRPPLLRSVRSVAVEAFRINGLDRPQVTRRDRAVRSDLRLAVEVIQCPLLRDVTFTSLERSWRFGADPCVSCVRASVAF